MTDIAVVVLLKPIVLGVLFSIAWIAAFKLKRFIPAGKVKTFLYRTREYGDWLVTLMFFIWFGVICLMCWAYGVI